MYKRQEDDASVQDALLCIQTGKTLDDENRMKFQTSEFYLKSLDEMEELFSYIPDAVSYTHLDVYKRQSQILAETIMALI